MAASAGDIARLRRMTNEPDDSNGYSDSVLADLIELYPLLDADGRDPSAADWTPRYDLHSAASDVWTEKAAVVAPDFAFGADGGTYQRHQVYQQYINQAHYHAARRSTGTGEMLVWPKETNPRAWIGNLPETD